MITPEFSHSFQTAIGFVRVTAVPKGIAGIEFVDGEPRDASDAPEFLRQCAAQLREYFDGQRTSFHSLPIVWRSTDFQRDVWEAAEKIPYGETRTYGELADIVGHHGAARAVGTALGRNPLCIIIPCHRIIPAGGSPQECGHYAGGEWRKRWLLTHEAPM
jgi:methylated-DNA-[protein]-cysteine S-methyltransferase